MRSRGLFLKKESEAVENLRLVGILNHALAAEDSGEREESHADSASDNSHDKEELAHIDSDNALVAQVDEQGYNGRSKSADYAGEEARRGYGVRSVNGVRGYRGGQTPERMSPIV